VGTLAEAVNKGHYKLSDLNLDLLLPQQNLKTTKTH
jgi:hypothetical protein